MGGSAKFLLLLSTEVEVRRKCCVLRIAQVAFVTRGVREEAVSTELMYSWLNLTNVRKE